MVSCWPIWQHCCVPLHCDCQQPPVITYSGVNCPRPNTLIEMKVSETRTCWANVEQAAKLNPWHTTGQPDYAFTSSDTRSIVAWFKKSCSENRTALNWLLQIICDLHLQYYWPKTKHHRSAAAQARTCVWLVHSPHQQSVRVNALLSPCYRYILIRGLWWHLPRERIDFLPSFVFVSGSCGLHGGEGRWPVILAPISHSPLTGHMNYDLILSHCRSLLGQGKELSPQACPAIQYLHGWSWQKGKACTYTVHFTISWCSMHL